MLPRHLIRRRLLAAAGACVVLASAGCGKEQSPAILPAKGIVLLNGKPLPKAAVRFIPRFDVGPEFIAVGVTDDQGRYELMCHGAPGACAGEHIVAVAEADIPKELQSENAQAQLAIYLRSLKNRPIPSSYSSLVQSPLKVTVAEGQAEYKLELRR